MRTPKKVRIFDGKKYTYLSATTIKSKANKEAKEDRKEGWLIRIVKDKYGYLLYKRRK